MPKIRNGRRAFYWREGEEYESRRVVLVESMRRDSDGMVRVRTSYGPGPTVWVYPHNLHPFDCRMQRVEPDIKLWPWSEYGEDLPNDLFALPLSKGRITLVDPIDYDETIQFKWHAAPDGNRAFYAMRNIVKDGKRTLEGLHRFIMKPPQGMDVDHVNGNTLDNRRNNLRICTRAQNTKNRGKTRFNTSGFKGVIWYPKTKCWKAQIGSDYKHYHIGYYSTKEEAFAAYCEAASRLHGEFAKG